MRIVAWLGSDRGRRCASGYLVLQALLGIAWWSALFTVSTVRAWFELMPDRPSGLDAYLIADALVFVGGSVAAAATVWRRSRWASIVTSFTAGGIAYATLHLLGWVILEGSAAAGLLPMGVALVATTLIAIGTRPDSDEHG